MANADPIEIEVVYAQPAWQDCVAVRVVQGTSVEDAVRQSGILDRHPEIELSRVVLGIFARRVPHDALVRAGDRVEIYRPLQADPKRVRRERGRNRKV
jgi:putative ubiquitin-RnfH superfamily antitoxin RatB of RatAB toxin-antitoxin module